MESAPNSEFPQDCCALNQLKHGQRGHVVAVRDTSSAIARRLLSMGIIAGSILTVCGRAPLGDPIHIESKGFALLLRSSEAALVQVRVLPD